MMAKFHVPATEPMVLKMRLHLQWRSLKKRSVSLPFSLVGQRVFPNCQSHNLKSTNNFQCAIALYNASPARCKSLLLHLLQKKTVAARASRICAAVPPIQLVPTEHMVVRLGHGIVHFPETQPRMCLTETDVPWPRGLFPTRCHRSLQTRLDPFFHLHDNGTPVRFVA